MVSVAIIGPDGAGKSTICQNIASDFYVPVKYLYMGVSLDSSNTMLPTTRLVHKIKRAAGSQPDTHGPRSSAVPITTPKGLPKRIFKEVKALFRLGYWLTEEWYRQVLTWYYQISGKIVIFDRHFFFDYYHYDIAKTNQKRSLARRIHGFVLQRFYPKPDLVIFLDAPGEVLYARKKEGTIELLEQRRHEFLEFQNLVKHFVIVDVTQSKEKALKDVKEIIWKFYQDHTKGNNKRYLMAGNHVKK